MYYDSAKLVIGSIDQPNSPPVADYGIFAAMQGSAD
jgi:hypothetical protein